MCVCMWRRGFLLAETGAVNCVPQLWRSEWSDRERKRWGGGREWMRERESKRVKKMEREREKRDEKDKRERVCMCVEEERYAN